MQKANLHIEPTASAQHSIISPHEHERLLASVNKRQAQFTVSLPLALPDSSAAFGVYYLNCLLSTRDQLTFCSKINVSACTTINVSHNQHIFRHQSHTGPYREPIVLRRTAGINGNAIQSISLCTGLLTTNYH